MKSVLVPKFFQIAWCAVAERTRRFKITLVTILVIELYSCIQKKATCKEACVFQIGDMAKFKVAEKKCIVYKLNRNSDCSCYYGAVYFNELGEKITDSTVEDYELIKTE